MSGYPLQNSTTRLGTIAKWMGLGSCIVIGFGITGLMPLLMLLLPFISSKSYEVVGILAVLTVQILPLPLAISGIVMGRIALRRNRRDQDAKTGSTAGCIVIFLYGAVIGGMILLAVFLEAV